MEFFSGVYWWRVLAGVLAGSAIIGTTLLLLEYRKLKERLGEQPACGESCFRVIVDHFPID